MNKTWRNGCLAAGVILWPAVFGARVGAQAPAGHPAPGATTEAQPVDLVINLPALPRLFNDPHLTPAEQDTLRDLWHSTPRGADHQATQQRLATERATLERLQNNHGLAAETKAVIEQLLAWNGRGRLLADLPQEPAAHMAVTAAHTAGQAIFGGSPGGLPPTAEPKAASAALDSSQGRGGTANTGAASGSAYGENRGASSHFLGGKGAATASGTTPGTSYGAGPSATNRITGGKGEYSRQQMQPPPLRTASDVVYIPHSHTNLTIVDAWPVPHSRTNLTIVDAWPVPRSHTNLTIVDAWPVPHSRTNLTIVDAWPVPRSHTNLTIVDTWTAPPSHTNLTIVDAWPVPHHRPNRSGTDVVFIPHFSPAAPALASNTVKTASLVPGQSVHTPPPGYRGSDVMRYAPPDQTAVHTPQLTAVNRNLPPANSSSLMFVDAVCPKHGPYGGQIHPGEKLECPKCKADRNQALSAPTKPLSAHTPPPLTAVNRNLPPGNSSPLMFVDAVCPKHGPYGGQVRPGEKLECPKCKAERNQATAGFLR